MRKKQIAAAIIVAMAIPFGIRQVIQSNSADEPQRSEQQASVTPVTKPSGRPPANIVTPPPAVLSAEPAAPKQVKRHNSQDAFDRFADFQARLEKELGTTLTLDREQLARLEAVLENRRQALMGYLPHETGLDINGEGMKSLGALIRGDDLRGELAEILTEEQLSAYDTYKQAEWSRRVEGRAYQEFSKISPILLDITEEQKDQVFGVIYNAASTKVEGEQDFRAVMGLLNGRPPSEIDPLMVAMGKAAMMAEKEGINYRSEEFAQALEQAELQRIEKELEPLAPILSEQQLALYRKQLIDTAVHTVIDSQR